MAKRATPMAAMMSRNSHYRRALKKNATPQELIVKRFLEAEGVKFQFQKGFLVPFHRIVDFYLSRRGCIIEIDGGYHSRPDVAWKDRIKDQTATTERKMYTLRITNQQVDDGSFVAILRRFLWMHPIRPPTIRKPTPQPCHLTSRGST